MRMQANGANQTIQFPNGDTYTGGVVDGERHGKGRYTFENGDVYEGSLKVFVDSNFKVNLFEIWLLEVESLFKLMENHTKESSKIKSTTEKEFAHTLVAMSMKVNSKMDYGTSSTF